MECFAEHLRYANASVHIPHPKIDKLACQAQGVGITERSGVTGLQKAVLFSMKRATRMKQGFAL